MKFFPSSSDPERSCMPAVSELCTILDMCICFPFFFITGYSEYNESLDLYLILLPYRTRFTGNVAGSTVVSVEQVVLTYKVAALINLCRVSL